MKAYLFYDYMLWQFMLLLNIMHSVSNVFSSLFRNGKLPSLLRNEKHIVQS